METNGLDLEALGRRMRALRKARGLSQGELALTFGAQRQTIAAIERGQVNPTVATLAAIANGLGVTLAELVDPDNAKVAAPTEPDDAEGSR